jgi:hypothetical protein
MAFAVSVLERWRIVEGSHYYGKSYTRLRNTSNVGIDEFEEPELTQFADNF